jgi:hypothetical protein
MLTFGAPFSGAVSFPTPFSTASGVSGLVAGPLSKRFLLDNQFPDYPIWLIVTIVQFRYGIAYLWLSPTTDFTTGVTLRLGCFLLNNVRSV